ncbi:hypothetical protein E3O55_08370 [Cryobacterium sp. MDB1-18-2]|uniref:hypothetical protein n=1 Tax=unclassified Cryobacterium TaxID=2649013 RepID=UPI001068EA6E|nr:MULTISPECIES: hypothetical protein [unclassified Cryobacterium]TFC30091.1 hypothetical protein E3O55_08370 [Cryobacterium sp. MDB1-18-2]TFC41371.1 hypothetical protein E3O50_09810 [Cryobacterium sp. MDB1-18-1]
MAKTFTISAEYAHTLVGRAAVLEVPAGRIPVTIGAVRYEPESGLVLIDWLTMIGPILGWMLAPAALVEVVHA